MPQEELQSLVNQAEGLILRARSGSGQSDRKRGPPPVGMSEKAAQVEQLPALRAAAATYVGPDSKEWEIGKKFCLWSVAPLLAKSCSTVISSLCFSLLRQYITCSGRRQVRAKVRSV